MDIEDAEMSQKKPQSVNLCDLFATKTSELQDDFLTQNGGCQELI